MSLEITFKPLGPWPKKATTNRKRSPFKYRWTEVLSDLERELRHLGARSCEIQISLAPGFIRRDGWPRSDARPSSPAVILSFTARNLPNAPVQVYPCDTYGFWQDNIVAIARSLEKLRAVDRYGVTTAGEQYAGFKALPASTAATMGVEQAAEVIATESGYTSFAITQDASACKAAMRIAIHRTHPDRNAGKRDAFDKVDAARKALSSHHGVSL